MPTRKRQVDGVWGNVADMVTAGRRGRGDGGRNTNWVGYALEVIATVWALQREGSRGWRSECERRAIGKSVTIRGTEDLRMLRNRSMASRRRRGRRCRCRGLSLSAAYVRGDTEVKDAVGFRTTTRVGVVGVKYSPEDK
jgi:hypothetical protein